MPSVSTFKGVNMTSSHNVQGTFTPSNHAHAGHTQTVQVVVRASHDHHGRTASCPAAPAQISACGTTAPGSSKLLASHIQQNRCGLHYSEAVANAWFSEVKDFYQFRKSFSVVTAPLTTAAQYFEQNPLHMMKVILQAVIVPSDSVVFIISTEP